MKRTGPATLTIEADTIIEGNLFIRNDDDNDGAVHTTSLSDYIEARPIEAGTWETAFDFGVNGICSEDALFKAGLTYTAEDGLSDIGSNDLDEDCNYDNFGIWCPNG